MQTSLPSSKTAPWKTSLVLLGIGAAMLCSRPALARQASVCLSSLPSAEATVGIGSPVAYRLHRMTAPTVFNPYALAGASAANYPNDPPLGSILSTIPEKTWTATPDQVTTDAATGDVCFKIQTDTFGLNNSIASILYKTAEGTPSIALITADAGAVIYHGIEDVEIRYTNGTKPPFYQAPVMSGVTVASGP